MSKYRFGLMGYPLDHSFSPIIHQAALDSLGLIGEYELFPVKPFPGGRPELKKILSEVRNQKIIGLNVTIPHKQNVIGLIDELSPVAKAIGAVNTVYLKGDKLIGDNTDAQGFYTSLKKSKIVSHERSKVALVLGAGGSARAVVFALGNGGWKLYIAARRKEQAQEIIQSLFLKNSVQLKMSPIDFSQIADVKEKCQILINTTPVGMFPEIDDNPWPADLEYPSHLNFFDLIYNPPNTQLSLLAEKVGAKSLTGMGMLIEQAALSFELWTGKDPDRKIITQAAHTNL